MRSAIIFINANFVCTIVNCAVNNNNRPSYLHQFGDDKTVFAVWIYPFLKIFANALPASVIRVSDFISFPFASVTCHTRSTLP